MGALVKGIVQARPWLALVAAGLFVVMAIGQGLPAASYVLVLAGAAVVVGALVAVIAHAGLKARRRQP